MFLQRTMSSRRSTKTETPVNMLRICMDWFNNRGVFELNIGNEYTIGYVDSNTLPFYPSGMFDDSRFSPEHEFENDDDLIRSLQFHPTRKFVDGKSTYAPKKLDVNTLYDYGTIRAPLFSTVDYESPDQPIFEKIKVRSREQTILTKLEEFLHTNKLYELSIRFDGYSGQFEVVRQVSMVNNELDEYLIRNQIGNEIDTWMRRNGIRRIGIVMSTVNRCVLEYRRDDGDYVVVYNPLEG